MADDGRTKLPRIRHRRAARDEHEQRLATAGMYARKLTETGSRCHLNDGSLRFCHWAAAQSSAVGVEGGTTPTGGVRCAIHPGDRYLDSSARLDPSDFA